MITKVLFGKDADGKSVPMNLAVYGERHSRAGEVLDPEFRNNLIRARLSGIDLSGGFDGGDPGPDDGDDGNDGSGNAGGDAGESDAP